MFFYYNNRVMNMSQKELDSYYLGEGLESTVYLFDEIVVKIYKSHCRKIRLNEEDVKRLSKIETERIVMPEYLVYDDLNKFSGYTMKYIPTCIKIPLKDDKINNLVKEIEKYEKDIETLSKEKISIYDLNINNAVINNGIYSIDPGSFRYKDKIIDFKNNPEDLTIYIIKELNREEINSFFIEEILEKCSNIPKKYRFIFEQQFNYSDILSDQIKDTMYDNESVKQYTKRLIKNKDN